MTASSSLAAPPRTTSSGPTFLVRHWSAVILGFFLLLYALYLGAHFSPAIAGPDDNGYYAQATLLSHTGHTWFVPQSDAQYIGMHWLLTPSGKYISRYPPGLPVLIAALDVVFGWKVAAFTNPLLAIAGLVGFYLLLYQVFATVRSPAGAPAPAMSPEGDGAWFLPGLWALAGTLLLALNPLYLHHALSGDAHVASACFLMWGLFFLVRWSARPALRLAFAAGLFLGMIPAIRYADAIMGLGAAVYMFAQFRRVPRFWRHFAAAAAGVAIPLLPLLIRNQLLLGAFWRTGYALTHEQSGFGWEYFREAFVPYIRSLNDQGIGLFLGLGAAGMVAMALVKTTRHLAIAIALMAVPMLAVYMAYYWGGGGSMRFILPTFPLYILAGVWLLRQTAARASLPAAFALAGTLVILQGLWGLQDFQGTADRDRYQKESLARVTGALDRVARPGDVIITNNAVAQQLDFVRKWKVADQMAYQYGPPRPMGGPGGAGGAGGQGGGPNPGPNDGPNAMPPQIMGRGNGPDLFADDNDTPNPQQVAKMIECAQNYSGTLAEREQKFMADIIKWAGGKNVWLIGEDSYIELFNGTTASVDIEHATRVHLPEAPVMAQPRGPGGGRGPGRGPGGQGRGGQPGGPGPGGGPQFGPNGPPMGGGGGPGQQNFGPQGQGFQGRGGPQNFAGPGRGQNIGPQNGPGFGPQGRGGPGNRGMAGGGPQGPGFQPVPQGGRGPAIAGPMNGLQGQSEITIAQWNLK